MKRLFSRRPGKTPTTSKCRLPRWAAAAATAALALGLTASVRGAVGIQPGSPVTENFDTLGTSATATLPTDWKVDTNAVVRTVGTYAAAVTATWRLGGNDMGTSAPNGVYNYGAGVTNVAPDRAVGWLSSSSASKSGNLYVALQNSGATTIESLQVDYNVEKYRKGSNAAGFSIQMYYSTDGTAWTSAGAAFLTSFPADADNTGYTSAPGATVAVSGTLTGLSVAAGGNLYLAWNYSVTSGTTTSNAQGLGVDDVTITANAAVQPALQASQVALNGFMYIEGQGPSGELTYTLTGSDLSGSGNITVTAPTGFEVSAASGSGFGATVDFPYTGGQITGQPVTVYVRMAAGQSAGDPAGSITHSGGGVATPPTVALTGRVRAPIALTGAAYTQDFDAMGASATADLPAGWFMSPAGAAAPNQKDSGNFLAVNQQASSGTLASASGGRYNWGATGGADRAAGFMTTGSYASPNGLMAAFKNAGADPITNIVLSCAYERYRINTAAAAITLFYSTDGSSWTSVPDGDSGAYDTGSLLSGFPLDTRAKSSLEIAGLNIPVGGALFLRWNFDTTGTNSQGLGLDDVSVAANTTPQPALTLSSGALSGFLYFEGFGPSGEQSYTLSGSALTGSGNLTVTAPTGYEVSAGGGSGFGATADFPYAGGQITGQPVTVYVRMAAGQSASDPSGSITHSGGGVATPPEVALTGRVRAPIALTGSAYTQDFDAMGTSAAADLPAGWFASPAGDTTPTATDSGNSLAVSQQASSGEPTSGGRYNWGATGGADRAAGFMTSSGYASPNSLMAAFRNDGASAINELTVSCDYERYRLNTSAAAIALFYSTDGSAWTAVPAGDSGAYDTGASAYGWPLDTVARSNVAISGLNVAVGGALYLRWDFDTTGTNSQGLGVDNVVVTPGTSGTTVLAGFQALTLSGGVTLRWVTTTEVGTVGFDVYRKVGADWVRVNALFISAAGSPGAEYRLDDAGATPGGTYEYKLVETTGSGTVEYGPYERETTWFELVSPVDASAAGVTLHWVSRAGEVYRVSACDDLIAGVFTPLETGIAATPPENTYTDITDPLPADRVYRIELE